MATIKSALSLYDGMTGPLKHIHTALNTVLNTFEAVQTASGNAIDTAAIQSAREELARAGDEMNQMEQNIRDAEQAQDQFNGSVREGATAADSLQNKLKGILGTVISIAGIKSALGWVKENLELSDTQRNAENQLRTVLANMGVEDIEIPVTANTEDAVNNLNTYADQLSTLDSSKVNNSVVLDAENSVATLDQYSNALTALDGSKVENTLILNGANGYEKTLEALDGKAIQTTVTANTSSAINAVNRFGKTANQLDGSTIATTLALDNRAAVDAATAYEDWANRIDGKTIQTALLVNGPDYPGNLEATLALDTGGAVASYTNFVNAVDGNTVTTNVAVDTTQTMSAFDAIAAKASEIQGRGIYGDEAMIAGAAEFATYFTDAEAIISMMDTLSNYAMGMSGGGALDSTAMVDYATGLGKIMSGSYEAMTKKGFAFSDAQKAVIEGTATHAQYVEALGADYKDLSEDMRAATVINSVIAEGWDGLYESMSNTPEGKIIQFNNTLGDMREVLGDRLYPAVLHFFDAFTQRFPQIETLLTGFADACSFLITVLTWIATAAVDVASAFAENWGWIGPIVYGVAGAYLFLHGAMLAYNAVQAISTGLANAHAFAEQVKAAHAAMAAGATLAEAAATTTATGAQVGLNAALLACPLTWIVIGIIAIIAALYAAVGAINHFAGTSVSATGIIGGAFAVLGAHVINTFIVPFWNALAAIANFIGNVFNDPVAAVKVLFYDMALTVVGYIKNMAEAIEAVINKIPGVTVDITSGLDNFYSGLEQAQQKVKDEAGWVEYVQKMDFVDYTDAAKAGYKFGEGVEDKVTGMFKMPTLDEMGFDNFGNNLEGIYGNTGDTAANTAKSADKLEYMDEDLKWMRDIAEREAINRYTTAEITVRQENQNYISKDTDLDGIMDAWAADFAEKLEISGEGV